MIQGCPPDFTDESIIPKCQKNQSDSAFTYLMDLPVINRINQIAYGNVFCAICHGDLTNLKAYDGSISCNNQNVIEECGISITDQVMINSNYNPGKLSWTLKLGGQIDARPNCTNGIWYAITCSLEINGRSLFEGNKYKPMRTCPHPGTIGTCNVTEALAKKSVLPVDVERFENFCKLYTMLVVFEDKLYKNPHCAVCNGVPLNRTRCISKTGKCQIKLIGLCFVRLHLKV